MKIATLAVSAAVLISLSMPANAQESLVKFIEHYNGVEVRLDESAAKCDAKDKDLYAKKVGDGLQAIGITPNPQAITRAYLFIMAVPFGAMNQRCALFMSLLRMSVAESVFLPSPSKKYETGTPRTLPASHRRLALIRLAPDSYFCNCWNVTPSCLARSF
jgi:hypothetical protein